MSGKVINKQRMKSAQKTTLLSLKSGDGYERMLHPFSSDEKSARHPYTQEVLLLGVEQGLTQEDMAGLANVSQPQISQWLDGQSKATGLQLEKIIRCVSAKAPGNSFHLESGIIKSWVEFPDDWQFQMLKSFLSGKTGGNVGSEADVDEILRSTYSLAHKEEIDGLTSVASNKLRDLYPILASAERIKRNAEDVLASYVEQVNRRSELKAQYVKDHPQVKSMDEKDLEEFLEKTIDQPDRRVAFKVINSEIESLVGAIDSFELTLSLSDDEDELVRINSINSQLLSHKENIDEKLRLEIVTLEQGLEDSLTGVTAFNNFEGSNIAGRYEFDCEMREKNNTLKSLGDYLYGNKEFSYLEGSTFYRERGVFTESYSSIFSSYAASLEVQHERKDIQICGDKLISGSFGVTEISTLKQIRDYVVSESKPSDNPIFTCYRLFHGDFILKWNTKLDQWGKPIGDYHIKRFDCPNNFLSWIEKLLTLSDYRDYKEKYTYYRDALIEAGYCIDGVESYF